MKTMNLLKSELKQFYGTEKYYHTLVKKSLYTDGMKYFLENAGTHGAYWLYDIIQTEIFALLKQKNPDTYYLKVTIADNEANILLSDYRSNKLFNRHIDFTDLPTGEIEFHVGYDGEHLITCLPSEN